MGSPPLVSSWHEHGAATAAQTLGIEKQAFLGAVARGVGRLATPAMVAGGTFQGATGAPDNHFRGAMTGLASTGAGLGAGAAGGAAGAALGTLLFPGVGTAIGGIAGNILGYMGADKYITPFIEKHMPGRRASLNFRPQVPGLPRIPGTV